MLYCSLHKIGFLFCDVSFIWANAYNAWSLNVTVSELCILFCILFGLFLKDTPIHQVRQWQQGTGQGHSGRKAVGKTPEGSVYVQGPLGLLYEFPVLCQSVIATNMKRIFAPRHRCCQDDILEMISRQLVLCTQTTVNNSCLTLQRTCLSTCYSLCKHSQENWLYILYIVYPETYTPTNICMHAQTPIKYKAGGPFLEVGLGKKMQSKHHQANTLSTQDGALLCFYISTPKLALNRN